MTVWYLFWTTFSAPTLSFAWIRPAFARRLPVFLRNCWGTNDLADKTRATRRTAVLFSACPVWALSSRQLFPGSDAWCVAASSVTAVTRQSVSAGFCNPLWCSAFWLPLVPDWQRAGLPGRWRCRSSCSAAFAFVSAEASDRICFLKSNGLATSWDWSSI